MVDIRGWPIERVMLLPDRVFGARYVVSVTPFTDWGTACFDMAEGPYPERMILWHFGMFSGSASLRTSYARVALGDQLPATEAAMESMWPLIRGLGEQGAEPRKIRIFEDCGQLSVPLRVGVDTGGRRLVAGYFGAAAADIRLHVITVVSAVPSQVPEWAISGME